MTLLSWNACGCIGNLGTHFLKNLRKPFLCRQQKRCCCCSSGIFEFSGNSNPTSSSTHKNFRFALIVNIIPFSGLMSCGFILLHKQCPFISWHPNVVIYFCRFHTSFPLNTRTHPETRHPTAAWHLNASPRITCVDFLAKKSKLYLAIFPPRP